MNKQRGAWFFGWLVTRKGSSTSGNYGHKGRKGLRGGSMPGGGHMAINMTPSMPQSMKAHYIQQRREKLAQERAAKKGKAGAGKPAEMGAGVDAEALTAIFGKYNPDYKKGGLNFPYYVYDQMSTERLNRLHNLEEGLNQQRVASAIVAWDGTSNDHDMRSLSLQEAASEEFGIPLSDYQKNNLWQVKNDKVPSDMVPVIESTPDMLKPTMPRELERMLVRNMYDETQKLFQEAGYKPTDTVRVFRGVGSKQWTEKGEVVNMAQNTISSWSLHPGTAHDFADAQVEFGQAPRGIVLSMEVPVSSILSTPRTGFGMANEGEIVVLGIPGNKARVTDLVT